MDDKSVNRMDKNVVVIKGERTIMSYVYSHY